MSIWPTKEDSLEYRGHGYADQTPDPDNLYSLQYASADGSQKTVVVLALSHAAQRYLSENEPRRVMPNRLFIEELLKRGAAYHDTVNAHGKIIPAITTYDYMTGSGKPVEIKFYNLGKNYVHPQTGESQMDLKAGRYPAKNIGFVVDNVDLSPPEFFPKISDADKIPDLNFTHTIMNGPASHPFIGTAAYTLALSPAALRFLQEYEIEDSAQSGAIAFRDLYGNLEKCGAIRHDGRDAAGKITPALIQYDDDGQPVLVQFYNQGNSHAYPEINSSDVIIHYQFSLFQKATTGTGELLSEEALEFLAHQVHLQAIGPRPTRRSEHARTGLEPGL